MAQDEADVKAIEDKAITAALAWMKGIQAKFKGTDVPGMLREVADSWDKTDGKINVFEVLTLIYYLSLVFARYDPKRMFKELTMIAAKILDNTIGGLL